MVGFARWISDEMSDKTQSCWVSQEEEEEGWLRKAAGLSSPAVAVQEDPFGWAVSDGLGRRVGRCCGLLLC